MLNSTDYQLKSTHEPDEPHSHLFMKEKRNLGKSGDTILVIFLAGNSNVAERWSTKKGLIKTIIASPDLQFASSANDAFHKVLSNR
jgi:hypothetical protein